MSLISATAPTETPQAGVKRPLQGNPTTVPNNLPAFRGKRLGPAKDVKVPKLNQGNRPNEGSNIPIPYNRVCPLEFLSGWTGRLSPGDVAFVLKYPPGFLSKMPGANNGTAGTATMSRVIGLDGVNRLLHGASNPDGWVAGDNVLVLDAGKSPLEVLNIDGDAENPDGVLGGFKGVSLLQSIRLDGIVKSNDEPYAFTSSGSRDAVVFNNIIQGPAICNNGYLLYDPRANPGVSISGPRPQSHGATGLRTVEAYPRGSIEGGYHIGGSTGGTGGIPGRVGSPWLGNGQYDYVATFTGTYTTYPGQMFDRNVQPMNALYLGLRAYELSTPVKRQIVDDKGQQIFGTNAAANAKSCYFFQIVPFASRKAWLCQHVQDRLAAKKLELLQDAVDVLKLANPAFVNQDGSPKSNDAIPAAALEALRTRAAQFALTRVDADESKRIADGLAYELATINATLASHKKGEKKSRFDDDVFDAVRSEDLANMVGAWHVGRVLDIKAMRHAAYEGGPSDTGFALTVDVQVGWRNALPLTGGSITSQNGFIVDSLTERGAEFRRAFVDYGTNKYNKDGTRQDSGAQNRAKNRLAVDVFNAQFPSMRAAVGDLFGSALYRGDLAGKLARAADSLKVERRGPVWESRVPARWPVLFEAWVRLFQFGTRLTTAGANVRAGLQGTLGVLGARTPFSNEEVITFQRDDNGIIVNDDTAMTGAAFLMLLEIVSQVKARMADAIAGSRDPETEPMPPDAQWTTLGGDAAQERLYRGLAMSAARAVDALGLGLPTPLPVTGVLNSTAQAQQYRNSLGRIFGAAWDATANDLIITKQEFFYILSGLRIPKEKKLDWYLHGPDLYPTLSHLDNDPISNVLSDAVVEETVESLTTAKSVEWNSSTAWALPGVVLSAAAELATDAGLGKHPALVPQALVGPADSGAGVGAAAAAPAAAPAADAAAGSSGAATGASADPMLVDDPFAAAPAAAPAPARARAPVAAPVAAPVNAPVTAAAMAAAARVAPAAGGRGGRKSPARTRTGAAAGGRGAGAGAGAAAAATATAPTPTPTPTPVPIAAAAGGSSAAAGAAGAADGDLLSAPAPPAARRRDRGGANTSTVASVFDSIFGTDDPDPQREEPASPTPSSGSESGPKTFKRPR